MNFVYVTCNFHQLYLLFTFIFLKLLKILRNIRQKSVSGGHFSVSVWVAAEINNPLA